MARWWGGVDPDHQGEGGQSVGPHILRTSKFLTGNTLLTTFMSLQKCQVILTTQLNSAYNRLRLDKAETTLSPADMWDNVG
jgi:hypothetical protein